MVQPGPLTALILAALTTGCCPLAREEGTDSKEGMGRRGTGGGLSCLAFTCQRNTEGAGETQCPSCQRLGGGVHRLHLAGSQGHWLDVVVWSAVMMARCEQTCPRLEPHVCPGRHLHLSPQTFLTQPSTPLPWPTVGPGDAPGSPAIWGLAHSGLEDKQLAFDGSLKAPHHMERQTSKPLSL